MEIIFHNVNVILPNGEIFASGDKSRIGKIHEAGRKAALDKKRVNIYPQNANLFKGVAPGINQPIIIDGEVQLVIGVTGNPNEIVRYAELAFLTAELLITQAISNENSNRKSSLKDLEFATLIFDPKRNPIDENKEKELEGYIKLPKYIYLIVIEKIKNYQDVVYEAITKIRKLPNQSEIIVLTTNIIIVLNENKQSFFQEKNILKEISNSNKIKILIGKYEKISTTINQYASLLPLIGSGIKILESEMDNAIEESLSEYDLDDANYLLQNYIRKLKNKDILLSLKSLVERNSQANKYIETINIYIEENQEVTKTAERLKVHRNTIQKRFDSIEQITGLNPSNFKDLMILYMILNS